jgi:hypothetical protein
MPLAAPLILPFAELAGITIAGLGMAAALKKVSDFISDNPEISTQILTTLVPGGVGLNALFKKKAKEDSDDESVEVAPEDKTREERAKEMKKRFKEGKGDKREIGKKGFEEVIKPVKDIEDLLEGEERYDGSLEDAPKPKFDYTKFFKADGGRVNYANGGRGYNNMSITRAQIATQLLNEMAPKGEKLAYINNREAELLKRMGGAGVDINKTGIKSYVNFGSGRGSVAESLSQAAFGSSGPTFSSDGESGSFTPKGNFATITKGGGGGNDQPITEIRPNFNYNIDPFSINPRLNFKNIASIIYLQEFLDKKARGEDADLEADINFRDQLGNLDIFGNLGRSGNIVGANIPFLQSGIASLAYSPDTGLAAGLRGNLTEDLSGGVSFQDGQQNVNFNYDKGPFSAGFTSGPEENNIQVGFKMPFADGGRIGYQAGGVATPEQYAAALQKVGAGTETQKRTSLGNYLGDYIATQGQKLGNAAVIPFQAAKGVLGIQGTPITDSMQTSLQNIIQNQIKNSGKLSGNINYNDYGVKTNTQGNEFLGFGDRSFTDPEAALATTLGQASYSVDPKTGKITFTGGTAYDFGDNQFGGLGKFISKGGVFNQLPSVSNKFQPGATEYNPDITLGSDFMKQFNQPKYPDYKTAALQSQYYKNNPSNLDSDLFRAAYARALPDSGIKTRITNEGQVATDYGNYDPSRVYSAYMGNTGTSSSNPFFDQFKGSQYADMPTIMEAMYGTPGNMNPYYANGGLATMFRKKQ